MAAFAEDKDLEEEYEEVPDDKKLAIGTHFLMSSPPGEIEEVLKDLRTLLGTSEHILTDEILEEIFHTYNIQNLQVAIDEDGKTKVVLSPETEIDIKHYLDCKNKTAVSVKHNSRKIIEEELQEEPAVEEGKDEDEFAVPVSTSTSTSTSAAWKARTMESFSSELEALRLAVEKALSRYISSQYGCDTATTSVVIKDNQLKVLISGEKLNLKNYWSGRWNSTFTYVPSSQQLSGTVKLLVHYFEDGNVQMTTEKLAAPVTLDFEDSDDVEAVAATLISELGKAESAIQDSLEVMYLSMGEETFKDMRRILPISKQKMDWSGAQMQLAKGFVTKK
eukprot:CAMPEP_0204823160 /NCGR_PEP_ID=MMETSP1346-20131115/1269_1 /ASSEMBLY_ACC=CAM_ASM_000771 /TAXON_ID=215587 /ORGANISM="Aplanochytrium stocchinoi, Strain GSBS06" /LENGTH=333 /DNA_ID=CAMNT_0051949705 /DNA_START=104 /DNA_END=1105 /DNA_ORIENTATION=-